MAITRRMPAAAEPMMKETVRIPRSVWRKFEALRAKEGATMSWLINQAIDLYLKERGCG